MFQFEKAAEWFEEALRLYDSEESRIAFLAAKRLSMKESDYLDWLGRNQEQFPYSQELEKRIRELLVAWDRSETRKKLVDLRECKNQGNRLMYRDEIVRMNEQLKQEYRELVRG